MTNTDKQIEYYKRMAQKAGELRLRETEKLWHMIDLKEQAEKELKKTRDELEQRVKERTADLVKANDLLRQEAVERKQILVRLSESEEKYRAMFDDSLESMTLTANGVIWDVNPAWLGLFGYASKEEVIGRRLSDMIQLGDHTPFEIPDLLSLQERMHVVSAAGIRKDSSALDIEVYSNSISIGGDTAILTTIRDVTERKRMEQEKARLESRLRQSEKMEAIGTLAGGVAHDLNNILGGIIAYPELLLMDLPEDSPFKETVLDIKKAGQKAAAIVKDLLVLARRGVTVSSVLLFNNLIRDYLKSPECKRLRTFHDDVDIKTQLAPNLLHIKGSPIHLYQVVMNLVSNAAEAMPNGGAITIRTENRYISTKSKATLSLPEGEYVTVCISDTGMGISEEEKNRIFEPFYTKKVMGRSGTGLGMTVVWGTVQDHDGHIEINSVVDEGTDITIWLRATREVPGEETKTGKLDEWRGNGETVLVVDDVKEQQTIASSMLRRFGYTPATVSSGEAAVAYLRTHAVDLVLLDMIMDPGIDGCETYRRILEIHPGQKAVVVSGYSESDRVQMTMALGANRYILKPYSMLELGEAIYKELKESPPEEQAPLRP